MSQNPDDTYENTQRAAPYVQGHIPAASSSQSPASSSSSLAHQNVGPLSHPLQVVSAPHPDRPKRKRLAKACDACHKSKRRCDGTAPCSNCFFASKQCTYTDSSGRAVSAPRVAAIGPGSIAEVGSSGQHTVGIGHPNGSHDAHSGTAFPHGPQQSSYGHAGPPYYLPPPLLFPHQQSQALTSSHQHSYTHPVQPSNPNIYPTPSKRERNANAPSSSSTLLPNQQSQSRKRPRKDGFVDSDQGADVPSQSRNSTIGPTLVGGYATRPSLELEPSLTRELTNLFFTHSHPILMIIHKPSFTNALTLNQVPMYLLYTVCAVASPYSKQPSLATTPQRCAGRPFADEAIRLMFAPRRTSVMGWPGGGSSSTKEGGSGSVDSSRGKSTGRDDNQVKKNAIDELSRGELVLAPSLYTAQALCLLSIHEFLATEEIPPRGATLSNISDSELGSESSGLSSRGERFRELALQMIQELGIHKPQYPLLTPVPSQAFIEESIEKECVRRIFWVLYISDSMRGIYSGVGYRRRYPTLSKSVATQKNSAAQGNLHSTADSIPLYDPYISSAFNPSPTTPHTPDPSTIPYYNSSASFSPPIPAFTNGLSGFTQEELRVRLPVDETSFEMGVVYECMPEYLYLPSPPAPSTDLPYYKTSSSGSELAQVIRILTIYQKIERALDILYGPAATSSANNSSEPSAIPYQTLVSLYTNLRDCQNSFAVWEEGFPRHLRWDEGENVVLQKSMLETNSNTGAWCFCLTAIIETSCIMGLTVGRQVIDSMEESSLLKDSRPSIDLGHDWWKASHRKKQSDETSLDWAVKRLDNVLEVLGDRASKSGVMGCWLWPLIKYIQRNDEKVRKEIDGFEEYCGIRMDKLSITVLPLPSNRPQSDTSVPQSVLENSSRLTDATMIDAPSETHSQFPQEEFMPQAVSDIQPSMPSASSVAVAVPNSSTAVHQLPMLQTQTSLPSLKSSGLLDWSSRTLPAHVGHTALHHGLPQLSIGGADSNAYATGLGTLGTTPTTTAISGIPVSTERPKSPSSPTTASSNQGRSGLSWMMNE